MQNLPSPTADAQLLEWLLLALAPMNRTRVKQVQRSGRVHVNGTSVTRHDHPLRPGDAVSIARDAPPSTSDLAGITIVYEDAHLIVIDKPSGLLTVATESEKLDTAFVRLSTNLAGAERRTPLCIHRLDRDTSGLLLCPQRVSPRPTASQLTR